MYLSPRGSFSAWTKLTTGPPPCFDYTNMTAGGLVDNTMTIFGSDMCPVVLRGYVLSNYPLFAEDTLVQKGARFGGLVEKDFAHGHAMTIRSSLSPEVFFADESSYSYVYFYASHGLYAFMRCHGDVRLLSPQLRTRVITDVRPVKA
jgi:hypothetical protein